MSAFTGIVIMGFLMTIGGVFLAGSPMITFMSAGYFIIFLFLIAGIMGIIRAVYEKRYGKDFIFAILSLFLGIAGFAVPGAAASRKQGGHIFDILETPLEGSRKSSKNYRIIIAFCSVHAKRKEKQ